MAFSGTPAVFTRLYKWVNDAAANLFISATRMDQEMDGFAAAFNLCMLRDGKGKPSTDIPFNNHKITELAPGVAATDAATVGQVSTTQWSVDSSAATRVSDTVYKVATDKTTFYHPGRRVQLTGTAGFYRTGTVISSSYAAPDTTITVVVDSGVITTALDKSYYGVGDYATPGYLSPRTAVQAGSVSTPTINAAAATKFTFDAEAFDSLNEYDHTTSRFTAKYPGIFRVAAICGVQSQASLTPQITINVNKNGISVWTPFNEHRTLVNLNNYSFPATALVQLNAGDYLEIFIFSSTAVLKVLSGACSLSIDRIV